MADGRSCHPERREGSSTGMPRGWFGKIPRFARDHTGRSPDYRPPSRLPPFRLSPHPPIDRYAAALVLDTRNSRLARYCAALRGGVATELTHGREEDPRIC